MLDGGAERLRRRVPTPQGGYDDVVVAVRDLALALEREAGAPATVGIGTPGSLSATTGLLRNSNSIALNGRPFARDIAAALDREVRIANDADCFSLSEAADRAGAGHRVVFGVILGTGVGGGIVVDGRLWTGGNGIAGEWGHNLLAPRDGEAAPRCWCGRSG
ncbi:MAG: ROK family protein, partial [Caldimonas sp.]